MRDFRTLLIWQKGFLISLNCFQITKKFPKEERYGLVAQINRSGISIPSNIAEGCGRENPKDFNRFIHISLGSSFELETQLLIAKKLKYGEPLLIDSTIKELKEIEKMLLAFSKNLLSQL